MIYLRVSECRIDDNGLRTPNIDNYVYKFKLIDSNVFTDVYEHRSRSNPTPTLLVTKHLNKCVVVEFDDVGNMKLRQLKIENAIIFL